MSVPKLARVGVDSAGGLILGGQQHTVFYNGNLVAVVGDSIQNHGSNPHNNAILTTGSTTVKINGISVVRAGDSASCGHLVTVATGTVFSG